MEAAICSEMGIEKLEAEMKIKKIEENSIITLENRVELLLIKKFGKMFFATNYSNPSDEYKYIIEPIVKKNGDVSIHIVHRVKEDIITSDQLEEILKNKMEDDISIEMSGLSTKEEQIVRKMRNVLDKEDYLYTFDKGPFPKFTIHIMSGDVELKMNITYSDGHIEYRIPYPVDVRIEYKILTAIYLTNYNLKNAFKWNMDYSCGSLSLTYAYDVDDPVHFEETVFAKHIRQMSDSILEQNSKIKGLCKGDTSDKGTMQYIEILRSTLSLIVLGEKGKCLDNLEIDEEDYGDSDFMEGIELLPDESKDDLDDESIDERTQKNILKDLLHRIAQREVTPTFDRQLQLSKEQIATENNKKISNNILPFEDAM